MTDRAAFNEREWLTLLFAPLWAFRAVAGIDHNIDPKEAKALDAALKRASEFKAELVREVLTALGKNLEGYFQRCMEDKRRVYEGLQEVSRLLAQKVRPDEAGRFKKALVLIAESVAHASGGGFLGFGKKVSKDEEMALAMIARTLKAD